MRSALRIFSIRIMFEAGEILANNCYFNRVYCCLSVSYHICLNMRSQNGHLREMRRLLLSLAVCFIELYEAFCELNVIQYLLK